MEGQIRTQMVIAAGTADSVAVLLERLGRERFGVLVSRYRNSDERQSGGARIGCAMRVYRE